MDKKVWLKVAAGLSFFMAICQAVISLSPAAAAYFKAPATTLEEPPVAFSSWRGSNADLCHFWPVCIIRSRKYPTFASVTPRVDWDQYSLPFPRAIFHLFRVNHPGDFGGRNPDPGRAINLGIFGSGNRLCGGDCFKLERDAKGQKKDGQ